MATTLVVEAVALIKVVLLALVALAVEEMQEHQAVIIQEHQVQEIQVVVRVVLPLKQMVL